MAFVERIKFRKLDSELTENEFFNQFCKSISRQTIVSALYNYFDDHQAVMANATSIQKNIMLQRKKGPEQRLSHSCIDELPSELISNCSSFLPFVDYFRFAQCNRTIYYSCYSPSKITELDMHGANGDKLKIEDNVQTRVFKNVVKLGINLKSFNEWSKNKQKMWDKNNSVRSLKLYGSRKRRMDEYIQPFLTNTAINADNLSVIGLIGSRGSASSMINTIIKLGTSNTKDIIFSLFEPHQSDFDRNYYRKMLRQKLPNVEILQLCSNSIDMHRIMIDAFHDQLRRLHVAFDQHFSDDVHEAMMPMFKQNELHSVFINIKDGSKITLQKVYEAFKKQSAIKQNHRQHCLLIQLDMDCTRDDKGTLGIGAVIKNIAGAINKFIGKNWEFSVQIVVTRDKEIEITEPFGSDLYCETGCHMKLDGFKTWIFEFKPKV